MSSPRHDCMIKMLCGNWTEGDFEEATSLSRCQIHTTWPERLLGCAGTPFRSRVYTHAPGALKCGVRSLGPWLGSVRRGLWASDFGLPSTQAGSAAYLVAGAQAIVAVCHHFPVQEADERVLRAADGRRGRSEENLQARHGRSRLLWGRKERSWQCRKPLRLGGAGLRAVATPRVETPFAFGSGLSSHLRRNTETCAGNSS